MKKLFRFLLIMFFVPVFILLLILSLPLIVLLMVFYSMLAGRKWVNGIKWYTKTARGDAVKKEFKRQEKDGVASVDSVYDIKYDVLMSSSDAEKGQDVKKPAEEGRGAIAQ